MNQKFSESRMVSDVSAQTNFRNLGETDARPTPHTVSYECAVNESFGLDLTPPPMLGGHLVRLALPNIDPLSIRYKLVGNPN